MTSEGSTLTRCQMKAPVTVVMRALSALKGPNLAPWNSKFSSNIGANEAYRTGIEELVDGQGTHARK